MRYKGLSIGKMNNPIEVRKYVKNQTIQGNIKEVLDTSINVFSDRKEVRGKEGEFNNSSMFDRTVQFTIHYMDIDQDSDRIYDTELGQEYKIEFIEQIGKRQGLRIVCTNIKNGN